MDKGYLFGEYKRYVVTGSEVLYVLVLSKNKTTISYFSIIFVGCCLLMWKLVLTFTSNPCSFIDKKPFILKSTSCICTVQHILPNM